MHSFSASPKEMLRSLLAHRSLIWQMTKREVVLRYRGSLMGLLWSFFNPVLMLAVYTFVFSFVFKSRWSGGNGDRTEFAVVLFAGMLVYGLFAECVNRAPTLVISNVNYVKKVVFPLEILPWVSMGSTLFHSSVSLFVLLGLYAVANAGLNWTIVFFPLLLAPLILMIMGFCWFLASLGVYLRDVNQTISLITSVLMFLSPVFYPVSTLPPEYRPLMEANPLTFMIEQAREVLIWGHPPSWGGLAVYAVFSMIVSWAGFAWFQKTRRGFADVL